MQTEDSLSKTLAFKELELKNYAYVAKQKSK